MSNKRSSNFYAGTSMGEGWEANPVLDLQAAFIDQHMPDLRGRAGGRVLDLGCGHGTNSSVLFGDRPDLDVVGLDISPKAIASAAGKRAGTRAVREFVGEVSDLPVGRVPYTADGRVGKFGWKGKFATLEEFVSAACANELGLGTRLIGGLTQQLQGKQTITRDNGVKFELVFPAAK